MIALLRRLFKRPRYTERDIEHWERVYRLQDRQRTAKEALGARWVAAKGSTFEAWNKSPVIEIEPPTLWPANVVQFRKAS